MWFFFIISLYGVKQFKKAESNSRTQPIGERSCLVSCLAWYQIAPWEFLGSKNYHKHVSIHQNLVKLVYNMKMEVLWQQTGAL